MAETSDYLTAYANRSAEALFGPAAAPIKEKCDGPRQKKRGDHIEINELLKVWRAKRL